MICDLLNDGPFFVFSHWGEPGSESDGKDMVLVKRLQGRVGTCAQLKWTEHPLVFVKSFKNAFRDTGALWDILVWEPMVVLLWAEKRPDVGRFTNIDQNRKCAQILVDNLFIVQNNDGSNLGTNLVYPMGRPVLLQVGVRNVLFEVPFAIHAVRGMAFHEEPEVGDKPGG